MNALKDLRTRVTTALDGLGLSVYDHVPGRPHTPAAVITPGVPYITAGQTFGEWTINLVCSLIAATGPNEVATDALDDLITRALPALNEWAREVGPYYRYEANGATYLAVDIDIYDINDLKEV